MPNILKDPANWIGVYGNVAITGEPISFERFSEDRNKWYHVSAYSPQKGYFISLFEDITERRRAEENIAKNNKRLELLSSVTSELLSTDNPQNLIQEICEKVMHILNCDVFFNFLVDEKKDQLHLNAYAGVTPETAATFEWLSFGEAVCGCAAQEGKRIVCKNIPDTEDHRTALVRSLGVKAYAANPIFSDSKVIGTLSFGTKKKPMFSEDELSFMKTVTAQVSVAMQRKKTEKTLEEYAKNLEATVEERTKKIESDALYTRSLIEANLDPLVTINAEGKITDVNSATEFVTGYSRQELIGSDFSKYFTEPQKAAAGYRRVFTDRFVKDYPLAIKHKSGKLTEVLYNASVYQTPDGQVQGVFAAARDITERKILEKKLHESERLAAIGATAAMVGHDIRNPLQAITSDVFLIKSDLPSISEGEAKENMKESLDSIEQNVQYINKIVQDLQDFARPINPTSQVISLKMICEDVLFKITIPENIDAISYVEKEVEEIVADSEMVKRILSNLVINAFQAMPDGGKIFLHAYQEEEDVVLTVQDTGQGIPEEIKPKLFTPLFTTKSKGQGFGLAVVKRMTEALGGEVSYESKIGEGTKFIVRFPKLHATK